MADGRRELMDKEVWLSPRALRLHATVLVVVPGCVALCIWQILRATSGNSLSWAYVFEWPFFAGYAVYMWWRFLHEGAPAASLPASDGAGGQAVAAPDSPGDLRDPRSGVHETEGAREDAELAAYNAYLAELAEQDKAAGR